MRCAAPAVAPKTIDGLLMPRGGDGAWDQGAVSSPVVRVYQGDNEQRWLMWYSGCDRADTPNGLLVPGAGKIGALPAHATAAGYTAAVYPSPCLYTVYLSTF